MTFSIELKKRVGKQSKRREENETRIVQLFYSSKLFLFKICDKSHLSLPYICFLDIGISCIVKLVKDLTKDGSLLMMTPLGYWNRSVEKGVEEGKRWKNFRTFQFIIIFV